MDGNTRSTTTRTLALVAMLVAAGVLFLRAQSLLSAPVTAQPVGSHQERSLTALLEPIIGTDQVHVSIQRNAASQTVWFIMLDAAPLIDGETSGFAAQIETIAIARGFDASTDILQITQTPFARATLETLPPLALAELGGLGLILLLSFGMALTPSLTKLSEPEQRRQDPLHAPATDSAPRPSSQAPPLTTASTKTAAALATAAPERTANIIRDWMRSDP